ncbi:unnamed protein product [Aphanomyces euteiches]
MKKNWIDHLQKSVKNHDPSTGAFKLCAPTRRDLVKWASNAWNTLSAKTIINGFEMCGLIATTSSNEASEEPMVDDSKDGDDVFDSIVELAKEADAIRIETDIFSDVIYEVVL